MRTPFVKGFSKLPSNSYKVSDLSETILPYRNQMAHLVTSICLYEVTVPKLPESSVFISSTGLRKSYVPLQTPIGALARSPFSGNGPSRPSF